MSRLAPIDNNIVLSMMNVGVSYRHRTGFLKREKFTALHDISLDLHHGESLGVIGNNGAGKSTILNVLSGIIRPDRGKMINRGHSTALLSLNLGFNPCLTGRDNAIMSGLLLGFRRKQVEHYLDEIITFSELEEFIDYPLHTYSTGMRARLGFSVALKLEPDILLIDEILSVGDADFKRKSQAEIERKVASDKSVVLVTHDAESISKLTNRVVWIERGKTLVAGTPEKVVSAYKKYLMLGTDAQTSFLHTHEQLTKDSIVENLPELLQNVIDTLSDENLTLTEFPLNSYPFTTDSRLRKDAEVH